MQTHIVTHYTDTRFSGCCGGSTVSVFILHTLTLFAECRTTPEQLQKESLCLNARLVVLIFALSLAKILPLDNRFHESALYVSKSQSLTLI